jgi:hypothetical protein
MGTESGVNQGFQLRGDYLLGYPVNDRRDAQRAHPAISLGDQHLSDRLGKITPAGHSIPKWIEVFSGMGCHFFCGHPVQPGTTPIGLYPFKGLINLHLGNGLCLVFFIKNHP